MGMNAPEPTQGEVRDALRGTVNAWLRRAFNQRGEAPVLDVLTSERDPVTRKKVEKRVIRAGADFLKEVVKHTADFTHAEGAAHVACRGEDVADANRYETSQVLARA